MGSWKVWLQCIVRTAVGAAANSIGSTIIDPQDFNFHHPAKLFELAGVGSLIAVAHYLQQKPLPDGIGQNCAS